MLISCAKSPTPLEVVEFWHAYNVEDAQAAAWLLESWKNIIQGN